MKVFERYGGDFFFFVSYIDDWLLNVIKGMKEEVIIINKNDYWDKISWVGIDFDYYYFYRVFNEVFKWCIFIRNIYDKFKSIVIWFGWRKIFILDNFFKDFEENNEWYLNNIWKWRVGI